MTVSESFDRFMLAKYRILLRARSEIRLPDYSGAVFRGGFGNALRRSVCVFPGELCGRCMLQDRCAYPFLFETRSGTAEGGRATGQAVPRPFVLVPPPANHYAPGEQFELRLILVGRGVELLPYCIAALEALARRGLPRHSGPFELVEVRSVHPRTGEDSVYGHSRSLLGIGQPFFGADIADSVTGDLTSITLETITPMRLKHQNALSDTAPFPVFFGRLIGRVMALARLYQDCAMDDVDHADLVERAGKVETVCDELTWTKNTRYSRTQQRVMKYDGLTGSVTYRGRLTPFLPYIALGEWIHVGQYPAFGLGGYRITEKT